MKKIRSIIVLLAMLASMSACVEPLKVGDDFLEKAPGVDVNVDSVFSKAEYARRFLWNAYSGLYYGLPLSWSDIGGKMNMSTFECLSDCMNTACSWGTANSIYYSGSYNAGYEDNSGHSRWGFAKEGMWQNVRKCWIFIENIERTKDMDEAEKSRLKAEAKTMIAMNYFDAFRHLGGLPIVNHALKINENFTNPRATVEETLNFMVTLLDEAIATNELPWALPPEDIENWDGRLTKAGAMGLKCKILLFAASPLFNDDVPYSTEPPQVAVEKRQVWVGSRKQELWDRTLSACEAFFKEQSAQGRYGLYTGGDYQAAFKNAYFLRGAGGGNPEMLISTRPQKYRFESWEGYNYYFPDAEANGMFNPTLDYVDMFPMADGKPFDWNNPAHAANPFANRDPRLYQTVLVNGAPFKGRKAEMYIGGRERTTKDMDRYKSGFGLYKYIQEGSDRMKSVTWPYLRMAEMYLIYAEALAETKNLPLAIQQVNLVRGRVGLGGLVESNPSLDLTDKNVLIKEILRERACELGLEDTRLFDMIRRKLADDFTKQLHGLDITRTDGLTTGWPSSFKYERFNLSQRDWSKPGRWSPKWYLAAFPPSEINKGYGLTQNPGW
ncbi:RagB/SusD family nutrient uptake outer membrane protein [uncultured Acetobacteroides sp.]|uniref:RagB/SusD family nutrient uptake outer membrane protein n=1 Tax=uncultured Acetobacteroides sp. TaxID=1760811 RepID=UPI0029F465B0|nr:RagB/SusD family nutrient uptake outer membrane protein [uncultured Acetobacteroides sp.]